jgi:hypothetical protein
VLTAAGAVPRDVELIIGKEFSPQVHSRIMQVANKSAQTAEKIWAERIKENEAWVNSIPELKARKAEADKKQCRGVSRIQEKNKCLRFVPGLVWILYMLINGSRMLVASKKHNFSAL